MSVLREMGSKCKMLSLEPPVGTTLRETMSFDVLIVKNRPRGLGCNVGCQKNPKNFIRILAYLGGGKKR